MYVSPFVADPQFLNILFCCFSVCSLFFSVLEVHVEISSSSGILSSSVSSLPKAHQRQFFLIAVKRNMVVRCGKEGKHCVSYDEISIFEWACISGQWTSEVFLVFSFTSPLRLASMTGMGWSEVFPSLTWEVRANWGCMFPFPKVS